LRTIEADETVMSRDSNIQGELKWLPLKTYTEYSFDDNYIPAGYNNNGFTQVILSSRY
jgi:hypothetical protein